MLSRPLRKLVIYFEKKLNLREPFAQYDLRKESSHQTNSYNQDKYIK